MDGVGTRKLGGAHVAMMRNLLGRLHARPPADMERIAAFWQVPLGGGHEHGQVGRLYRALIDPRAARAVWERLTPEDRALVRLLAVGDDVALTLREIADRLATPEADARSAAARLYRAGLIAREGDDDELPVGAAPRLFLPRELALLFRRIQDEIEAGDLSTTPLRALLELLDDAELEEAAQLWGLRVIPGLRERSELSEGLLRQVATPERIERVAAERRRDAAVIWRRIRDEPDDQPVPLAEAAAAAGLGGNDPRSGQRLRAALAELETALLVWHTYRSDGSRWLFVPAELRSPTAAEPVATPPLTPVTAATIEAPAQRHPHALAWDLLTLLRELTAPDAPPWSDEAEAPRAWLHRLNKRLWVRGEDVPPAGYLDLLVALARAEQLVRDEEGDDEPRLVLAPAARAWRDRSFPDQGARLRQRWLTSGEWIEGRTREQVEVWGADWRGFRRRLLALLGDLDPDAWYPVEAVAAWVAGRDPDLLGGNFTAATARRTGTGDRGPDARLAAVAEVVAVTLDTSLDWFGDIERALIPGHTSAVRVLAQALHDGQPATSSPPRSGERPLEVDDALDIHLHEPTPLRVWSLALFAEPERLERPAVYRVTAQSLARALAAGFDVAQVTTFLTKQGRAPLPAEAAARLDAWARGYRRVRLRRALLLTPDEPDALADLARAAGAAGLTTHPFGTDGLLVEPPTVADDGADAEDAVLGLLREHGYSPQWTKPPRMARS